MSTTWKIALVTLLFAIPAFLLGRIIWPDAAGSLMQPTVGQLPFFMFLSALEAVAFGIGISFLFFGWKYVAQIADGNKTGAWLSYIAIAWLLVSWWPHDNMHRVNGVDMAGLLRIEFMFHLTLIVASFVLAYYFFKFFRAMSGARPM